MHRVAVRLAVVDMNMPRMDGRQTVERLYDVDPSLTILIASGYTESQARDMLGHVRVAGYIKKPFRVDQLQAKIDAVGASAV